MVGLSRIGMVQTSNSGKTLYYDGRSFQSLGGQGCKANYFDLETGDGYWISGCRKDGMDAIYNTDVEIDEDVREAYWLEIRKQPQRVEVRKFRAEGKY